MEAERLHLAKKLRKKTGESVLFEHAIRGLRVRLSGLFACQPAEMSEQADARIEALRKAA